MNTFPAETFRTMKQTEKVGTKVEMKSFGNVINPGPLGHSSLIRTETNLPQQGSNRSLTTSGVFSLNPLNRLCQQCQGDSQAFRGTHTRDVPSAAPTPQEQPPTNAGDAPWGVPQALKCSSGIQQLGCASHSRRNSFCTLPCIKKTKNHPKPQASECRAAACAGSPGSGRW